MKTKDLVLEYLKTTQLHPTMVYKLEPKTALGAFLNWLKENKHLNEEKESNKKA